MGLGMGELVRVAAAVKAKAKAKGIVLGKKIGVITEDQAYYYVYSFLLMAWAH